MLAIIAIARRNALLGKATAGRLQTADMALGGGLTEQRRGLTDFRDFDQRPVPFFPDISRRRQGGLDLLDFASFETAGQQRTSDSQDS